MIFSMRILITSTMGHCKYGREYPSTIFASVLFLFSAFIQFMILSMRIFLTITMRQGKYAIKILSAMLTIILSHNIKFIT